MRSTVKLMIGAAAAALALPAAASAETLVFDFTGGDRSFNFMLEQGQVPDSSQTFAGANQITFNNVSGSFNGVVTSSNLANVSFGQIFFAPININATGFGFGNFGGPDLFNGSRTNPMFKLGTFNLIQANTGAGTGGGVLRISQAAAAVPEPGTWAMMILGFGLVGGTMRRRTKVRVSYAPA